jgi:hypothetical protein
VVSVADIARIAGCSKRTLEERFKEAGAPPPGRLAAWSLAAHAVWQMEVEGLPLKQVASQMGAGGSANLGARIRRALGAGPTTVIRDGGFPAALAMIDSKF